MNHTAIPVSSHEMLTPEALNFIATLEHRFRPQQLKLLEHRKQIQARIDAGWNPDFLLETETTRNSDWRISSVPSDLQDRRVEITGPVDRKMVINALNSGARVFMADFEDAHSPTWSGTLEGQINLRDAIRRKITYQSPDGKHYSLKPNPAVLFVRPRGLHLTERNVTVAGAAISASLFDFGLFLFHNASELLARGTGPYFYIPKLENHLEARFWNEVITFSEQELGLRNGTVKTTVLIETILAAFEMDEILYELRNHIVGLNCGRWDYIFSFIKKFRNRPEFLFPDRSQITMSTRFLDSYCRLLIATCHRRGAHAMGGMAAQIPIKNNPELNDAAMDRVRLDKEREVKLGHDGTWVSHPGLVSIAMDAFNAQMKNVNQLEISPSVSEIRASDLLSLPPGQITEAGLRANLNISLLYLEAWLNGSGCVPLYHLMEDAATAEISRAQVWHWIRHPAGRTEDGQKITLQRVLDLLNSETRPDPSPNFKVAREILTKILSDDTFTEFLTLAAYSRLTG